MKIISKNPNRPDNPILEYLDLNVDVTEILAGYQSETQKWVVLWEV